MIQLVDIIKDLTDKSRDAVEQVESGATDGLAAGAYNSGFACLSLVDSTSIVVWWSAKGMVRLTCPI